MWTIRFVVSFWILILSAFPATGSTIPTKHTILFIGDGMGLSLITAGLYQNKDLNLQKFSDISLVTTHSATNLKTDSGAAATALATGFKTANDAVGVDENLNAVENVFERAFKHQVLTGIVATAAINHATPAAFYAHIDNRYRYTEIAQQLIDAPVSLTFGGGFGFFIPDGQKGSHRNDHIDLTAALKKKFTLLRTFDDILNHQSGLPVAGLLAPKHLPKSRKREYSLSALTKQALRILSTQKQSFILLVEGSQIDWGGLNNDRDFMLSEFQDFDNAVGVGIEFAKSTPNTVLLVTGDHETGGVYVKERDAKSKDRALFVDGKEPRLKFASKDHTATMVPLFVMGESSTRLKGIIDNTQVGRYLIDRVSGP